MKSQECGSTALVNYSILPLKFKTINVLWKYMKKFGYIFQAGVFELFIAIKSIIYLNQVNAIKIYIKNSFCFV